jgi:hypothetical protein
VLLIAFSTGCSRTDLALKFADTFVALEIKDQFDLSGKQKDKAEEISKNLIVDIKKEFLPLISAELLKISKEVDSLDPAQAKPYFSAKAETFRNIGIQFYPIVARRVPAFAEILTEKNWKAFKENCEEKNRQILSEKTQNSRTTDNLEFFIGSLTPEQEKFVDELIQRFPRNSSLRAQNRSHSLNEFEKMMGPFSSENFKKSSLHFLESPRKYQLKDNEEAWLAREKAIIDLLESIFKTMTPRQKIHFKEKCVELSEQFAG